MLRGATAATVAAALALAAGCGGDDDDSAGQPVSYRVSAPIATFPPVQRLARPATLELTVKNTGRRTIPNVAATLLTGGRGFGGRLAPAFSSTSDAEQLASRTRPVWIVDRGPIGGDTAFGNTWALGSLAPEQEKTFTWRVVPVRAGSYRIRYRLFGSTSGEMQLRLRNGQAPVGTIPVRITGKPEQVQVTEDGRVVPVSG